LQQQDIEAVTMTVNYLDKHLLAIAFTTQDLLSRGVKLLKDLATKIEVHEDRASYWQSIFFQSKANGCSYHGEDLPHSKWAWPRDTWFQEQLSHHLKALELAGHQTRN
jgi:hypothetical protein